MPPPLRQWNVATGLLHAKLGTIERLGRDETIDASEHRILAVGIGGPTAGQVSYTFTALYDGAAGDAAQRRSMSIPVVEQAKIIKALQAELGEERANAIVRRALGDMYRKLGEKWWQAQKASDRQMPSM